MPWCEKKLKFAYESTLSNYEKNKHRANLNHYFVYYFESRIGFFILCQLLHCNKMHSTPQLNSFITIYWKKKLNEQAPSFRTCANFAFIGWSESHSCGWKKYLNLITIERWIVSLIKKNVTILLDVNVFSIGDRPLTPNYISFNRWRINTKLSPYKKM